MKKKEISLEEKLFNERMEKELSRSKQIMEKFFELHPEHNHTYDSYDYPNDYWDEILEHFRERDKKYKLLNESDNNT